MAAPAPPSVTATFASFLRDLHRRGLDDAARRMALMLVRDGIAVATAGADETGPRLMRQLAATSGSGTAATLIGARRRTSVADAARANCVAMHVLDWEPMWNPANHSLSTVLPALLALAEAKARRRGPFSGDGQPGTFSGEDILSARRSASRRRSGCGSPRASSSQAASAFTRLGSSARSDRRSPAGCCWGLTRRGSHTPWQSRVPARAPCRPTSAA